MAYTTAFTDPAPTREQIDARSGAVVLEFGTGWCQFCQAAQPLVASAFSGHPEVQHIRVEDGRGNALGRSFAVKLWPTLIFLRDGQEVMRLVRPASARLVADALARIDPPG
jgi:thioredoxin 1